MEIFTILVIINSLPGICFHYAGLGLFFIYKICQRREEGGAISANDTWLVQACQLIKAGCVLTMYRLLLHQRMSN